MSQPTASLELVRVGVIASLLVAAFACVFFEPLAHWLDYAAFPVFLTVFGAGIFVTRAALVRMRFVFLDELQAGYSTETTLMQGLFWIGGGTGEVVGWEWKGLWGLTSDGRVVSAPDFSVDPPGLYPSPIHSGRRQLWTGYQWANVYFDSGHR